MDLQYCPSHSEPANICPVYAETEYLIPTTPYKAIMPYYGFLMHLGNVTFSAAAEEALMRITMVGCGLSIMGVMLTLFLIFFLPLRTDSMFIVANMVVSLLMSQTCYLGIENSYPEDSMCSVAAGVLHYFFLCFHCWMLVYGLYLYLKLHSSGNHSPNWKRRYMYVLVGWLLPLLIVLVAALVNPKGYGMEHICWLSHKEGMHWAFVAPVLLIMLVNFPVFVMVLRASWTHDTSKSVPTHLKIRHQLCTIMSLIPVMGFTWIFGIAPLGVGTLILQYIFVILNPAQGFLILVCHMIRSGQVRAAWRMRFIHTPEAAPAQNHAKEVSVDTNSSDVVEQNKTSSSKKG